MRRAPAIIGALGLFAAGFTGCGESETERANRASAEETRAIMREIYGAIQVALPASVDPESFGAASNRAMVEASLATLANNAEFLEGHSARRDSQMQFLARSIARDARDVERAYAGGKTERAAFLLRQITENCVVCHTRLPYDEDSTLAEGFVDEGVFRELPLEPRANLQMATRRFDDALVTLEALLASDEHPALMLGPITDYLVVNIRVKKDFDRPVPVLERFAKRDDLWMALQHDVNDWIAALPDLRERATRDPDVETARALLRDGMGMSLLPSDQTPLAHFVVASAILEQFIDEKVVDGVELAEAYYLLGLVEARIGRNYWVTPAPFLLETAIRLAPGEQFAEDAYAQLERELLADYEGTDQEQLPEEDAARLGELRALIDAG